jgi:hypothetical protein
MKLTAIFVCLLGSFDISRADTFADWPVHFMSGWVEAIIVGEQTEGDRVQVKQWLFKPAATAPDGITVEELAKLAGGRARFLTSFTSRTKPRAGQGPRSLVRWTTRGPAYFPI